MDPIWDHPTAIQVADALRYLCLFAGFCFAAFAYRLIRDPWVKMHPTFRGFTARLIGMSLGVVLTVLLQYDRLGEPVHLLYLPLSLVHLAVAFYSVYLPVSDIRDLVERKLR